MRYFFFYSFLILYFNAFAQQGTVKDIDGNVYKTVKIGSQVWMAENLKTKHYRDGTPITKIELDTPWSNANTGAWCYYQNDSEIDLTYGKLYNWYAVIDAHHLCPTGWHVPSDIEWTVLTDYLGRDEVAGGKMKATTLWKDPNTGADNSSGFNALPAGNRYNNFGTFNYLGTGGYFWSTAVDEESDFGWSWILDSNDSKASRGFYNKGVGLSVRCVGD